MKRTFDAFSVLASAALLAGCASTQNMPLLFGQTTSVGISIGGSSTDQAVDFTLGYKDRNFAVVPVTVKQANGDSTQIRSLADVNFEDALSVLGQFEVKSDTRTANVGLGKFFATGSAAKVLADGFAAKLGAAPPDPAASASALDAAQKAAAAAKK
jgi:hypothetical protein